MSHKLTFLLILLVLISCQGNNVQRAEQLNRCADSAFVQMDYRCADSMLHRSLDLCPKGISAIEAHIALMRIAQRVNDDTEFFTHRLAASKQLRKTEEDNSRIRLCRSELHVVTSTYLYYMRDDKNSIAEIEKARQYIMPEDTLARVSFLYNLSAGGKDTTSFDNLVACYVQSRQCRQPYYAANALQSLAMVMGDSAAVSVLERCRPGALAFVRTLGTPEDMANSALRIFSNMGDRFQTACVLRTLGELAFGKGDYALALNLFQQAYSAATMPGVAKVSLLLMGIHEQLSMTYAMMGNKRMCNRHRAAYLELLAVTRQDREMEGRIATMQRQNMITMVQIAVLVTLTLVMCLLMWVVWVYLKRTDNRRLVRLNRALGAAKLEQAIDDERDELAGAMRLAQMRLVEGKRQAAEHRAKVSYIVAMLPLIERLVDALRRGSTDYVTELLQGIAHRNNRLTEWIQMRRGRLSLHIRRFDVAELLATVRDALQVHANRNLNIVVKCDEGGAMAQADRALTLFMLNTLADNACRYTPDGGQITLEAHSVDGYVEVSVTDTGEGMSAEKVNEIMTRSHICSDDAHKHHGFGLLNCRNIIESYRKMGRRFEVCCFDVTSKLKEGTRFFFRIPAACILIFFVSLRVFGSVTSDGVGELTKRSQAAQAALDRCDIYAYQHENAEFTRLYKLSNADPTLEAYSHDLEQTYLLQRVLLLVIIMVATAVLTLLVVIMLRQRMLALRQLREMEEHVAALQAQAEYEYETIHVQNEVLDNCLSAIKHETMYYPARLQQMLGTASSSDMLTVAQAYRTVFVALMRQAADAVAAHTGLRRQRVTFMGKQLWADTDLIEYFNELLPISDYNADLDNDKATIPHLIAKQILRDIDEMNGHPGLKLSNPQ